MAYQELFKIANIVNWKNRRSTFIKHYSELKIEGLCYSNFIPEKNIFSISMPNHQTNHYATAYLISCKSIGMKANTIRIKMNALKKFCDFLLVWNINLNEVDLIPLIASFAEYLTIINYDDRTPFKRRSMYYCTLKSLPLKESIDTNILHITSNNGIVSRDNSNTGNYASIYQTISTTIHFLTFLHEMTDKYAHLPLNNLPHKMIYANGMISGTAGRKRISKVDIDYFMNQLHIEKPKRHVFKDEMKPFTEEHINAFMSVISPNSYQSMLMFTMMRLFGLRGGELVSLTIDCSKINQTRLFSNNSTATEELKNALSGSIYYSQNLKHWICHVNKTTDDLEYDRQSKTGSRDIPLMYSVNIFETALLNAIRSRQLILSSKKVHNPYLFYNASNPFKGIRRGAVYQRFSRLLQKAEKRCNDSLEYTPHSFRHYYATTSITKYGYPISQVSEWLGHSSEEVTKETYYHYIQADIQLNNVVQDIRETFRENTNDTRMDKPTSSV